MPKNISDITKNLSVDTVPMDVHLKLKEENKALKDTVSKLLAQLDKERNITASPIIQGAFSPEMEIIELQIHRLQMLSREGKLKMEDAKILDILIKNKKLLNDEKPVDADFEELHGEVTVQEAMLALEQENDKKESN